MGSIHLAVPRDATHRVLAVKRVHRHIASEQLTRMLFEEAHIAACIRHENVVTTHGAEMLGDEIVMVMDYVAGLPFQVVQRKIRPRAIPARFAVAIMADVLRGLSAAHEARDANGATLNVVHRDVSPQNILVGIDGVARVIDFGVAKAALRNRDTRAGDLKGKLAYMAPEQLREEAVDRRTDVYAAALVLWEALAGKHPFDAATDVATYRNALRGCTTPPSTLVPEIPAALDAIVMRGLARRPQDRYATALEMACALDAFLAPNPVSRRELAAWLRALGEEELRKQVCVVADVRRKMRSVAPPPIVAQPPLVTPPLVAALASRSMRAPLPPHVPSRPRASLRVPPRRDLALAVMLFVVGALWGIAIVHTMMPAAPRVSTIDPTTVVM
jgi:serine/threonine-protein kinase